MQIRPTLGSALAGKEHSARAWLRLAAVLLLACFAVYGHAQEGHRFTFDAGGGVAPLTGKISNRLTNGWDLGVSGGINLTPNFATSLRFNYNGLGVSQELLRQAGVPDGNSHVWSLTVDPRLRLGAFHSVSPYVVGGVGYYRRTINFTKPAIATGTFIDPLLDVAFPIAVSENAVVRSISRGGIGGSVGGGFDFKVGNSGLKLFSEARYEYANTGRIPTRMVPVKFGVRW